MRKYLKRAALAAAAVLALSGAAVATVNQEAQAATEQTITAYVTGYGWWDNTPPGSSVISNPVVHTTAGGAGTWSDPITIAVGHSLATGTDVLDYPAGTIMYIPNVQKYFIVEDTCGDGPTPQNGPCHTGYPAGTTSWVDVWIGGSRSTQTASNACEAKLTGAHTVIINPVIHYYRSGGGDILTPYSAPYDCNTGFGETPIVNAA